MGGIAVAGVGVGVSGAGSLLVGVPEAWGRPSGDLEDGGKYKFGEVNDGGG